jgi:hypothetical protein
MRLKGGVEGLAEPPFLLIATGTVMLNLFYQVTFLANRIPTAADNVVKAGLLSATV